MSRAVRLVLGIVALAATGLALFLWLGTERGGSAPVPAGEASAPTASAEPHAPELAEPPRAEGEDSPRSSVHARPGDEVVVPAPDRLAAIVGRLVPPPGEAEVNLASVHLSCTLATDAQGDPRYAAYARREFNDNEPFPIQPEPGGSFVLPGLPVGVPLQLVVQHAWGPSLTERLAPFSAGEVRELVFALDAGLTLAGRVEDEHGAPVSGATVMARHSSGYDGQRLMDTGADGRFRFAHLERQSWSLEVLASEFARDTGRNVDGARDELELVLVVVRGASIAGTVVWASGEPADGEIEARTSTSGRQASISRGAFEVSGLEDETYTLRVKAKATGVVGSARLEGVRPGPRDLRIVLEPQAAFELAGRVVDEAGEPVPEGAVFVSSDEAFESENVAEGRFAFASLPAGSWSLQIHAKGFLSTSRSVSLGPGTGALRFVLERSGIVRGIVLDPRGEPVADAQIALEEVSPWNEVRSDAEGRFELQAPTTRMRLSASCAGHGASEALEVAVDSRRVVDIVLRLRDACSLRGQVLDVEGHAVAGAQLIASLGATHGFEQSDALGAFVFADLPPGRANVVARRERDGACARATVELRAGVTSALELRFDAADPVRLRGRIVRAGAAHAGELLFFSFGGMARATIAADGTFEVLLRRPGAWQCALWLSEPGTDPRPADVRVLDFVVPDVEAHELALDVDAMHGIASFDELGY